MAKVIFGNHSSVLVSNKDRNNIRKFYCDVLGGKITKADPERDFLRLGENFYIGFLYGDVPDEGEFLRTARSIWLEIKSDNVEETKQKILESGLVRKLEVPDSHFYFQAPGGQCLRLVGIDEDLSFYEGAGAGPDVVKVKEALKKMERKSYTVTIEIAKSANDIFNHIINDVSKYWPEDFEGECTKLNDEFVFRSGDSHYSKNKVVEFVQDKKVVWLVTESIRKIDNFEWTGSKMIFELIPQDKNTRLKFTYDGFILENEYDRLVRLCDMVIKETLYNLITNRNSK